MNETIDDLQSPSRTDDPLAPLAGRPRLSKLDKRRRRRLLQNVRPVGSVRDILP